MNPKFVFESFNDFINYKLLMNEAAGESKESKTTPWDFKFDSGKFKKSDVTPDQIKSLDADFKKKIVPLFNDQKYIGQKLEITISAASSKVPVNPSGEVAKELKSAGYAPNNEGLCKARGNTVVEIIQDLVYENFGEGGDRKEFLKSLEKKMELVNKPLPNIGPEYDKTKGDNADDQKYKDNQYISATLLVKGEKITEELVIPCNMDKKFRGGRANASNGFAGYDKKVFLRAKSGQKMTIFFDPVTIPDAILFSYTGKEAKLSPFSGAYGAKYIVEQYSKEAENRRNKEVAQGKEAPAKREVIGGISYLVVDYKDVINNVINKGGVLVKAIEDKLKSLGLKPINEICPEFFDSEGKIEVYRNKELSELKADNEGYSPTYDALKRGDLKQSPKADTKSLSIQITKNAVRDEVNLVAFSPIAGTIFNVKTVCK